MEETSKPETTQQEHVKKPGIGGKIKDKLKQYRRVLSVAHKPDKEEMISSMKITGSGIAILGAIGFVIFLLYFLILRLATGA
jgi:protein translocase SEC61 complex gamma subunit